MIQISKDFTPKRLNNFATALADLGDPKRRVYEFKLDEDG